MGAASSASYCQEKRDGINFVEVSDDGLAPGMLFPMYTAPTRDFMKKSDAPATGHGELAREGQGQGPLAKWPMPMFGAPMLNPWIANRQTDTSGVQIEAFQFQRGLQNVINI